MKRNSRLILLTLLIFCSTQIKAQVFKVDTLLYNGDPDKRINLVIMGDGYTISDTTLFRTNAMSVMNYFISTPPFNMYSNFFNFFGIEVISNESGTDHPGNASDESVPLTQPITIADTYLETSFDYGLHRVVSSSNLGLIYTVADINFPQYDIINVIVNSPYYGGSGGGIAFTSMDVAAFEVFMHEFGHSFAGLSDEYEYGSSNCNPGHSQYINVSQETDTSLLVWKNWLTTAAIPSTPGTDCNLIGLYPGAFYCPINWYRPKCNCKMKFLNQPFCEVCAEQIIYKINSLVDLNDNFSPQDTVLTICNSETQLFTVTQVKSSPNTIQTHWTVDGIPVVNNDTAFTFNASLYAPGMHQIIAESYDSTYEVKKTLTAYQKTWNVNVVSPLNDIAFTINGNDLVSPYTQSQWYIVGDTIPVGTTDVLSCTQAGNYFVTGFDSNGCFATSDTITTACTTGLNTINGNAIEIKIVPNPFTSSMTIYASGMKSASYRISVTDLLGQVLESREINPLSDSFRLELNTINFQSGIYFLIVSSENSSYCKKMIRE
ncbi:MAG: T9SS type A sorting domain-containing protein [Bacteroidetes bacterium]|nr:T9SS type A sorting domain-containing protein [Bacteroidota bacterium]